MDYFIEVWQNKKLLFRTDQYSCTSSDAVVRVYSIFLKKFPASEGFEIRATAHWKEYLNIDGEKFEEAIKKGKGKGLIMHLKKKHQKAHWMAYILFKQMKEGLL